MPQDVTSAFILLLVGMISVFIILCLIVAATHLLIYLVNRSSEGSSTSPNNLPPSTVAILSAVVAEVTGGKGTIRSIKRLK